MSDWVNSRGNEVESRAEGGLAGAGALLLPRESAELGVALGALDLPFQLPPELLRHPRDGEDEEGLPAGRRRRMFSRR